MVAWVFLLLWDWLVVSHGERQDNLSLFKDASWLRHGPKSYLFVLDEARANDLNRADAQKRCAQLNSTSQLVSVDSEAELEFLKKKIRQVVTSAGQEFANEQWWTAGKVQGKGWVWDRKGYPPGKQGS